VHGLGIWTGRSAGRPSGTPSLVRSLSNGQPKEPALSMVGRGSTVRVRQRASMEVPGMRASRQRPEIESIHGLFEPKTSRPVRGGSPTLGRFVPAPLRQAVCGVRRGRAALVVASRGQAASTSAGSEAARDEGRKLHRGADRLRARAQPGASSASTSSSRGSVSQSPVPASAAAAITFPAWAHCSGPQPLRRP
jgi:hypothetical protein